MKSHSQQLEELQKLQQQITNQRSLLQAQEEYLNSVPLETKIAAAHLEQMKKTKASLETELSNLESDIKEAKQFTAKYLKSSEAQQHKADALLVTRETKLSTIEQKIGEATKALTSINEESGTRKRYLAEQEKIITHMMTDANESINKANDTYGQLERAISSMEVQKTALKNEVDVLLLNKDTLENDVLLLEDTNTANYEVARKQLREVQAAVSAEKAQLQLATEAIESKKQDLHAEVEAIDAKRAALFKENEEFQISRRRDTNARASYGL